MNLEKEKEYLLGQLNFQPNDSFLAGGALTSLFTKQHINDFDIYFKSKEAFTKALEDAYEYHMWCVHVSSRAITFADGDDIYQYMFFKWFPTAENIFESYDFTACMGAVDLNSKEFVFHPRFLADVSKRELNFNPGTDFPLASGIRTLKYIDKGFSLHKKEMTKILTACVFKNITSWEELKEQLGGNYGEKVVLDTTKEFTLENAVEAIQTQVPEPSVEQQRDCGAIPCNFEEAYRLIFKEEPSQVL